MCILIQTRDTIVNMDLTKQTRITYSDMCDIKADDIWLGSYKTKARATEVLKDICDNYYGLYKMPQE